MKALSPIQQLAAINEIIFTAKNTLRELETAKFFILSNIGKFPVVEGSLEAVLKAYSMESWDYTANLGSRKLKYMNVRHTIVGIMCVVLGNDDSAVCVLVGKERTTINNSREKFNHLIAFDRIFRHKYETAMKHLAKGKAA